MRFLMPVLILLASLRCLPLAHAAPTSDAPPQMPQVKPGHTLVVFSAAAAAPSRLSVSEVAILHAGDNALVSRVPIDEPRLPSHFTTGWGYLHALQLVPGEYVVTLYSEEPYYTYAPESQQLRFKVTPGKPMYLGEARFRLEDGVGILEMRDQGFRDLTLFVQKNPQFKAADFRKRLAAVPGTKKKP